MNLKTLTDEQLAALERTSEVQEEINYRLCVATAELVEEMNKPMNLEETARALGWPIEVLIYQMVEDGLLIEFEGGLVASPHPDIVRMDGYKAV